MKVRSLYPLISLCLSTTVLAETHVVQEGDVLSRIVLKKYPNPDYRIYGNEGKIKDVMKLNPQLKAPHLIYPKQVIILDDAPGATPEPEVSIEITPTPAEETVEVADLLTPPTRHWDFSAFYGLKYVSYKQTKDLGSTNVDTIFLNSLQFNAEYTHNDWAGWAHLSTYKVKYVSGSASDSRQVSTYELGGSYKNYLATISIDESPLFKETPSPVEMSRTSVVHLGIGWRKQWNLESSLLNFKSVFKYPLSTSSSDSKVKLSDTKGFKVKGQLQWQYPFYKSASYELFADWQNDLSYQQLDQKVTWGTASGRNDVSLIEATSSIGIHLKY